RILRQNIPVFFENMIHQHERDMISWQTEWESLPEICLLVSTALSSSINVLEGLVVNEENMKFNLKLTNGLILSESIMLTLGKTIGRQNAHDVVYESCMKSFEQNVPLQDILRKNKTVMSYFSKEEVDGLFDTGKYIGYSAKYANRV